MYTLLDAIQNKDWHAANEAFASMMQAKLADRLVEERKNVFEEENPRIDPRANEPHTFVGDRNKPLKCARCGAPKSAEIHTKALKESADDWDKTEVQRVYKELGSVEECKVMLNLNDLHVENGNVISYR